MAFVPSQYSESYGDVNPDAIDAWTSAGSTILSSGIGIFSAVKSGKAAKKEAARRRRAARKRAKADTLQARIQAALAAEAPAPEDYGPPPETKKGPPIGLIVGIVAIVGVGGFFLLKGKKKKPAREAA